MRHLKKLEWSSAMGHIMTIILWHFNETADERVWKTIWISGRKQWEIHNLLSANK